jgi:hypothetical protein
MDRHDTDKLVQTGPPRPHDPARIVDREWIEDSISLWEEALSADLPSEDPEEQEPVFLSPEAPLTAPLAEDLSVEPESVDSEDGFEPLPGEELRQVLQDAATGRLRAQVSVELPEPKDGRPARRVYTFSGPVSHGESRSGTLYALGPDGLVRLDGDVQVARVVEVIENADTSPKTETLRCDVEDGTARWSRPSQDNSTQDN